MKTTTTLLLTAIISLSLHQDVKAQDNEHPFTGATHSISTTRNTSPINGFALRVENAKVYLDWTVESNGEVEGFEIETSSDGNIFKMAGLVFASERMLKEDYRFYEKVRKQNTFYRVKIIQKNGVVRYSPVLKAGAEKIKIN